MHISKKNNCRVSGSHRDLKAYHQVCLREDRPPCLQPTLHHHQQTMIITNTAQSSGPQQHLMKSLATALDV